MKKNIDWSLVLGIALFVGFTVLSVVLVDASYDLDAVYGDALKYAMRIVGYIGVLVLPSRLVGALVEMRDDEVQMLAEEGE